MSRFYFAEWNSVKSIDYRYWSLADGFSVRLLISYLTFYVNINMNIGFVTNAYVLIYNHIMKYIDEYTNRSPNSKYIDDCIFPSSLLCTSLAMLKCHPSSLIHSSLVTCDNLSHVICG